MSVEFRGERFKVQKDNRSGLLILKIRAKNVIDITEIKGLSKLTNLEGLDLLYNKISEIKGLENLTNLQKLDLGENRITDIKGLDALINLKELSFFVNRISEIKELENLTNLQYLHLGRNKIKEIKGLEHLTKLQVLFLSNNQIAEIKGVEHLTQLKNLGLTKNKITEIKGLERLTNLEILTLGNNHITEIKGLDNLYKLKTLMFNGNQIKEIKGLENLNNLRSLWLSNNKITEIKGFENLTDLRELWFENNQVTELKGLENQKKLQTLYLRNNKIAEIKGLANLSKLSWLDLYRNPVYKWTVKKFGSSEWRVLEEQHMPYVIAYCKKVEEKSKKISEVSVIDTSALKQFLINQFESEINRDFNTSPYQTFDPESPALGYITLISIDPWLWVKSRIVYRGATWSPSTDRLSGDRYEAHDWRDWIGLIESAPNKVSRPEELDEWALLATSYLREYTDIGEWGRHNGRWISDLQSDGTVTIFIAEGVFHDISPENAAKIEHLKLKM